MPPAKVPPVTATPAPVEGATRLVPSIEMPPKMVPELAITPLMVLFLIWMPVGDSKPVLGLTMPAFEVLREKLVLLTQIPSRLPVLPLITPALLMVPEKVETLAIAMPAAAAEIVPAFDMPPIKVGPKIWRAFVAEVIVLALSITIPWLEPKISPLSTIAPVMVEWTMLIAISAEIVPALVMPPENVVAPET